MIRSSYLLLFLLLLSASPAAIAAQESVANEAMEPYSSSLDSLTDPVAAPAVRRAQETRFDWTEATRQSLVLLTIQHGYRLSTQARTRRELGGPFFKDWRQAASGVGGWGDGDAWNINYVGHPMQGAVSGYIQVQNDPRGRYLEFSNSRPYWMSRMRALGWSAAYGTQFEIGFYSEAAIGNVGKRKGDAGFVDLVVTPLGGVGMIVGEDWLDKRVVQRLESRTESRNKKRFYRILFNPNRSLANLLRAKVPWHRDTRSLE